jgi:methylenetetrahydrofolate reductase (NADPH)
MTSATPPDGEPAGALDAALREGRFIVTAEVTSPATPNAVSIRRRARLLRGHVTAANVPDGQAVSAHVSPLAAARLLLDEGVEPVLTLQCRDRNRLALQSELLGAAALGIDNVLCLTGDAPPADMQPTVRPVFELDSLGLLDLVSGLNSGRLLNGAKPFARLVPGVAAHPLGGIDRDPVEELQRKAEHGARFAQTQYVFDVAGFVAWMETVHGRGISRQLAIIVSVGPLRSPRVLAFLARLPGVRIPGHVLARFDGLSDNAFAAESLRLAAETIRAVAEIPGVAGIHLLAPYWEEQIPLLIRESGIAGRTWRGTPTGPPTRPPTRPPAQPKGTRCAANSGGA